MMFKRGDIVTLFINKIGNNLNNKDIFEIVHSNLTHSSIKCKHTGEILKFSYPNSTLRKLSNTEIILFTK